jgi:hypothetical protein
MKTSVANAQMTDSAPTSTSNFVDHHPLHLGRGLLSLPTRKCINWSKTGKTIHGLRKTCRYLIVKEMPNRFLRCQFHNYAFRCTDSRCVPLQSVTLQTKEFKMRAKHACLIKLMHRDNLLLFATLHIICAAEQTCGIDLSSLS